SRGWDVPARLEVERRLGERDDVELIGDLLSFSEGGIAATHGVSFSRIDRRRWSGSVLLERADEFDGDAAVMVQVVGERLEPQLPVLIYEREHAFAAGAALERVHESEVGDRLPAHLEPDGAKRLAALAGLEGEGIAAEEAAGGARIRERVERCGGVARVREVETPVRNAPAAGLVELSADDPVAGGGQGDEAVGDVPLRPDAVVQPHRNTRALERVGMVSGDDRCLNEIVVAELDI